MATRACPRSARCKQAVEPDGLTSALSRSTQPTTGGHDHGTRWTPLSKAALRWPLRSERHWHDDAWRQPCLPARKRRGSGTRRAHGGSAPARGPLIHGQLGPPSGPRGNGDEPSIWTGTGSRRFSPAEAARSIGRDSSVYALSRRNAAGTGRWPTPHSPDSRWPSGAPARCRWTAYGGSATEGWRRPQFATVGAGTAVSEGDGG